MLVAGRIQESRRLKSSEIAAAACTTRIAGASRATCGGGGGEMAEPDWILERERRQMEQILELDAEELEVEEVDDTGSSSSSDVDTFLRNTHGVVGMNTSENLTVDTSMISLQAHTYLEAKVKGTQGKYAFLDGGIVLNLPMFYLQGVVLFPEVSLPLRVI